MKQGRQIRAGTRSGAERTYSDEFRREFRHHYLTQVVLGYREHADIVATMMARYGMRRPAVYYLLAAEGLVNNG